MGLSKIEWTHYTYNPWWGCEKVSPGCAKCYAETFSKRVGHKVWGKDSERRFFADAHWNEPLKWNDAAKGMNERRRVFCASMADVFEDRADLGSHRIRVFDLVEKTPWLDWLFLTKRPQNVRAMVPLRWQDAWPGNAWLGTTCENQEQAEARIPHLFSVPALIRFVSAEPLLESVDLRLRHEVVTDIMDLRPSRDERHRGTYPFTLDQQFRTRRYHLLNWVIVGGESGPGARPCNVDWIRSLVQQCGAAKVPVFVKQLGARPYWNECGLVANNPPCHTTREVIDLQLVRVLKTRDSKGGNLDEMPEDLRVREFPREVVRA